MSYMYDMIVTKIPKTVELLPHGRVYKISHIQENPSGTVYCDQKCVGGYIVQDKKTPSSKIRIRLYTEDYYGDKCSCSYQILSSNDIYYLSGYKNELVIESIFLYPSDCYNEKDDDCDIAKIVKGKL